MIEHVVVSLKTAVKEGFGNQQVVLTSVERSPSSHEGPAFLRINMHGLSGNVTDPNSMKDLFSRIRTSVSEGHPGYDLHFSGVIRPWHEVREIYPEIKNKDFSPIFQIQFLLYNKNGKPISRKSYHEARQHVG